MIRDFILSLIRTYVPLAVGAVATWLATRLDFVLDEQAATGLVAFSVLVVSGLYYLVARWLESRWSWLSVLLATPPRVSTPTYHELPKGA